MKTIQRRCECGDSASQNSMLCLYMGSRCGKERVPVRRRPPRMAIFRPRPPLKSPKTLEKRWEESGILDFCFVVIFSSLTKINTPNASPSLAHLNLCRSTTHTEITLNYCLSPVFQRSAQISKQPSNSVNKSLCVYASTSLNGSDVLNYVAQFRICDTVRFTYLLLLSFIAFKINKNKNSIYISVTHHAFED